MRLSGKQLAAKLGVSPSMVTQYKKADKIHEEPGGGYILKKVRAELAGTLGAKQGGVPRRGDRTAAKPPARRCGRPRRDDLNAVAKADLEKQALSERIRRERIKNDLLEESLVPVEQIEAETERRFRADADALLSWPSQISQDIAAELEIDEHQVFTVLDKHVRAFMRDRSMVGVSVGGK